MRRLPVLIALWAGRDVPEPQAFNVDPTRANAVRIPSTMPTMPVLSVPNVAIVPSSDDIVAVNVLVDMDVLVDVHVFIDMGVLMDLLSV